MHVHYPFHLLKTRKQRQEELGGISWQKQLAKMTKKNCISKGACPHRGTAHTGSVELLCPASPATQRTPSCHPDTDERTFPWQQKVSTWSLLDCMHLSLKSFTVLDHYWLLNTFPLSLILSYLFAVPDVVVICFGTTERHPHRSTTRSEAVAAGIPETRIAERRTCQTDLEPIIAQRGQFIYS